MGVSEPGHKPPRQLAHELLHAYNAHDPQAAADLYAEAGRHSDVANGRPRIGRAAISSGLTGLLRAFPDAAWAVEDVADGPGCAAVRYRLTGRLRSPLGPYRGFGQPLNLVGVLWVWVSAGEVTRTEDFWDAATFDRQMQSAPDTLSGSASHEGTTSS